MVFSPERGVGLVNWGVSRCTGSALAVRSELCYIQIVGAKVVVVMKAGDNQHCNIAWCIIALGIWALRPS